MCVIAFIEEPKVIDKIIRHLKLTFISEGPPPPHNLNQELLMVAEQLDLAALGVVLSFRVVTG
jgi:hypothetical protein